MKTNKTSIWCMCAKSHKFRQTFFNNKSTSTASCYPCHPSIPILVLRAPDFLPSRNSERQIHPRNFAAWGLTLDALEEAEHQTDLTVQRWLPGSFQGLVTPFKGKLPIQKPIAVAAGDSYRSGMGPIVWVRQGVPSVGGPENPTDYRRTALQNKNLWRIHGTNDM